MVEPLPSAIRFKMADMEPLFKRMTVKKTLLLTVAAVALGLVGFYAYQSCCQSTALAAGTTTASAPASKPAGCVNTRCPIMNKAIDPANVPEPLTRMYKGQKVGFCCGGCPARWDKLTDAEKDAKLEASK